MVHQIPRDVANWCTYLDFCKHFGMFEAFGVRRMVSLAHVALWGGQVLSFGCICKSLPMGSEWRIIPSLSRKGHVNFSNILSTYVSCCSLVCNVSKLVHPMQENVSTTYDLSQIMISNIIQVTWCAFCIMY